MWAKMESGAERWVLVKAGALLRPWFCGLFVYVSLKPSYGRTETGPSEGTNK
jgi:hypothetical protein